MNNSIIMIFTNSAIYKKAREVVKRKREEIPVYSVKLNDAVEFAKKRISEGTKVIISRGGVGMRLREELTLLEPFKRQRCMMNTLPLLPLTRR